MNSKLGPLLLRLTFDEVWVQHLGLFELKDGVLGVACPEVNICQAHQEVHVVPQQRLLLKRAEARWREEQRCIKYTRSSLKRTPNMNHSCSPNCVDGSLVVACMYEGVRFDPNREPVQVWNTLDHIHSHGRNFSSFD